MSTIVATLTSGGTVLHWATEIIDWVSRWDTWNAHSSQAIRAAGVFSARMPAWTPEGCYLVALLLIGFGVIRNSRQHGAMPVPTVRLREAANIDGLARHTRQWPNGPIVEPEVIQSADLRSVNVFVVNLGDDAAIDVTIAPIGGGSISFGVVRVLMASEPKAKVPIFIGADVPMLSLLDSRSEFLVAWERVKRKNVEKSRGALRHVAYVRSYSGPTVAGYVPLCLTYNYSHGRSFHTHDYVLADVSEYQIAIRRKSDSEAVLGASPEHA